MAAVCEICGKGPGFGKSVSHSHRRTSRRWNPNIQSVRAVSGPGGNKHRVNVCQVGPELGLELLAVGEFAGKLGAETHEGGNGNVFGHRYPLEV